MQELYAMYLRKSRADLELEAIDKMDTLARHEAILRELARRKGLQIGGVYKEIVSGENIASRPEMKRLLADVHKSLYRGVLVVEVERLARGDTKDQGTVAEAFKYTNTLIITPAKVYDPNNQFDEEYFEFGLFMSRREYKTIQRRLNQGKLQAIREGNFLACNRPYGYNIVRADKKTRTLVINLEEARVVKLIFDWRVNEQATPGIIASRLTDMGVPTYTGKNEWNRGTVVNILQNPVYAGKIRWNDRKEVKRFEGGELKRSRPRRSQNPNDVILVDGKHPAIVSLDDWQAANKDFRADKTKHRAYLVNAFAGLLVCAKCGKTFVYHSHAYVRNTQPRLAHAESKLCTVKSVIYTDLHAAVVRALQIHKHDFEVKLRSTDERSILARHNGMIEAVSREIENLKRQRVRLFDLFEREVYAEDDFVERKALLDKRKKAAEKQLLKLEATRPEPVDYEDKIIKLSDAIDALQDGSATPDEQNRYLKAIIESIEFSREDNDHFTLDVHVL